ncbi:MAG: trypsin-like peptidase domain-containing protein [Bacteroidia bacterium]|nr:trypsin-like peptidase domain-containing protein [Bacteroidia bacterium]
MKINPWLQKSFIYFVLPLGSGILGAWIFVRSQNASVSGNGYFPSSGVYRNANLAALPDGFEKASEISTQTVVFIKNESTVEYRSGFGWFWDFDPFGSRGKATSTGSGVIVSKDGYIVTNNHVIEGADKITVVLNQKKKEYVARVIGADPNSDLALLKIEEKGLPAIAFANSDGVQVGNWVLAVGNPFNLTSTVTAGIVSAKGRNINIGHKEFPIESFIQTDAAINPGNSGGALVNTAGELVGINTAIQSNTGSYSGYGFAIPSNIVQKIVKDFIEFGQVKRAFPGMVVEDLSADKAAALKYDGEGVQVKEIIAEGPAESSGLKVGDIIISVNDKKVNSRAFYDEYLAYRRPDETIQLKIWRDGVEKSIALKLISGSDNTALMMKGAVNSKMLGADFQPLGAADLQKYNIPSGIRLINIQRGGYISRLGLSEGFVITAFNGKKYNDAEDLISAMESASGRITIEGLTREGTRSSFSFFSY